MSHALSQVREFRAKNANIPKSLELEAIAESIMNGWDVLSVKSTREKGLSDINICAIRDLINQEGLSITVGEARDYIQELCSQ